MAFYLAYNDVEAALVQRFEHFMPESLAGASVYHLA